MVKVKAKAKAKFVIIAGSRGILQGIVKQAKVEEKARETKAKAKEEHRCSVLNVASSGISKTSAGVKVRAMVREGKGIRGKGKGKGKRVRVRIRVEVFVNKKKTWC